MSNWFVVLMGIGTVFFGLICIIALSMAMSAICRSMGGATAPVPPVPTTTTAPTPPASSAAIPNRQAMIAAIAAAIAEDLGTDPTGIRILSVKQI